MNKTILQLLAVRFDCFLKLICSMQYLICQTSKSVTCYIYT